MPPPAPPQNKQTYTAADVANGPDAARTDTQHAQSNYKLGTESKGDIVPQYSIDPNAYQNPVGDQAGNWQAAMANMLAATTGKAQQVGNTQLQGPQTYGGATVGPTATYGGATIGAGQYNDSYGQQQALANRLGAQAAGQGPSLAQVTAQQQAGQNLQSQMAMLGSARGGNPALAQQQALAAGASAQQQAAQQAVMGRTQEALGAQQQQAGILGAMNQEASGFAGQQAGLQQQAGLASMGAINSQNAAQAQLWQQAGMGNQAATNQFGLAQGQMNQAAALANLQSALQQGQINGTQYNNYLQMLSQQNAQQFAAQQANQSLNVNQQESIGATNAGVSSAQAQQGGQIAGAAMAGLGALAALSDRRAKRRVSLAGDEVDALLNQVGRRLGLADLAALT